jgi:hypothetical protein
MTTDEAIAACGGNARDAEAAVSNGYARGKFEALRRDRQATCRWSRRGTLAGRPSEGGSAVQSAEPLFYLAGMRPGSRDVFVS